jgi:hypothetical protein
VPSQNIYYPSPEHVTINSHLLTKPGNPLGHDLPLS